MSQNILSIDQGTTSTRVMIFDSAGKILSKVSKNLRHIMNYILLSQKFKKRFKNASPLEKPIGWNLPLGRIQRQNYGDGFLLLGDAAGLVDPFTGEGIGNGMLSGKYAAQVAEKAHRNNDFSKSIHTANPPSSCTLLHSCEAT